MRYFFCTNLNRFKAELSCDDHLHVGVQQFRVNSQQLRLIVPLIIDLFGLNRRINAFINSSDCNRVDYKITDTEF